MKRNHSNQNQDKKNELRKLVLAQLGKMRKKMKKDHPGMLETLREKMDESKKQLAATQINPEALDQQSELMIDSAKNQQTIEKMLQLKSENPGFERAVKAMLSKQKN